MEDKTVGWTVSVVLPVTDPDVAKIVVEPRASAVASPLPSIDATVASDEDQVTVAVMSFVLLSEYVPVAVYCWTAPSSKSASDGVTAIETSDADEPPPLPGAPMPGPRLPAPQPMNKLRHTKTIGARSGFRGLVRLVAWAILQERCQFECAFSYANAFTGSWLGNIAMNGSNTTAKVCALWAP
jgi:hypothetical protein